jgi:nitroreductase
LLSILKFALKNDFRSLANSRVSVRDYGEEEVDTRLIEEALDISMKTPSVCNRQTWMAHLVTNQELVDKILAIQSGFSGNGTNLRSLILVTTNVKYFSGPNERNQGYVDGGIYLMSLVYALTYKGLATCILNTDFDLKRESELRFLLRLEESELLIGIITIGTYPETFKAPVSIRDSYKEHLKTYRFTES